MSYPEHSLGSLTSAVSFFYSPSRLRHRTLIGESYPSAEMPSIYSIAPADCTTGHSLWSLTPPQKCSRFILQPQLAAPHDPPWPNVVEGNTKAPLSIASSPRCSGVCHFFIWIAPHTLDPYFMMLSVKQETSSTIFESLVWLDLGLNPGLSDYWWTL